MIIILKSLVYLSAVFVLHTALSILNIGIPPINIHASFLYTMVDMLSSWFFICLFIFSISRLIIDIRSKQEARIPIKISGLVVAFQISHFITLELAAMPDLKTVGILLPWINFIFLIFVIAELARFFSSEKAKQS